MHISPDDLDPRLAADSIAVATLSLSRVRLMNDARFPWLVLVPRRAAIEIVDLSALDRAALMEEIAAVSQVLRQVSGPFDKLNVGALGNVVPQLHVHIVARRRDDAAWPGPVWGSGPMVPYAEARRDDLVRKFADALGQIMPLAADPAHVQP